MLSFPQPNREWGENKDLTFSPDGDRLFLFAGNRDVRCLEVKTGKEVVLSRDKEPPLAPPLVKPLTPLPPYLVRPDREYLCTALAPVGKRALGLCAIWERGQQTPWTGIFDAISGERLAALDLQGVRELRMATLSPDGRLLVGSDYQAVMLWDARTGRQLGRLETSKSCPLFGFLKLAFSPDGTRVAGGSGTGYPTGGVNGSVGVWDVKTRKLLQVFDSRETQVNALAFSPDGSLLAGSGIHGGSVLLWDLPTGRQRAPLKHDSFGQFFALAFAPDGKTLAANWRGPGCGNTPAGVALWEVKSGRLIGVLKGCRATVEALAFSPGGGRLAALDWHGTVKVWQETPGRNRQTP